MLYESAPITKSTLGANELASTKELLLKVVLNGVSEKDVKPFSVTVMGLYVAPVGAVTVNEFGEAPVTVALAAPKKTVLAAETGLKPEPFIVTTVPAGPLSGANDVMTGPATKLRCNEITLPFSLGAATSGLPSPSKSPIAKFLGLVPVSISTLAAKLSVPVVLLLRITENEKAL